MHPADPLCLQQHRALVEGYWHLRDPWFTAALCMADTSDTVVTDVQYISSKFYTGKCFSCLSDPCSVVKQSETVLIPAL